MFALSLLRQQFSQIVQRYPAVVSVPLVLGDRVAEARDRMQWRALNGEPRVVLAGLWSAFHRPRSEAQKDLACAHLEILFADPAFGKLLLKDRINGFDPYTRDKEGILRMIGERGFEGYIGFLVSVMNQQWSQVWMVESFRVRRGLSLDDEEAMIHREAAGIIEQLLSMIGESRLIRRRFEVLWLAKVDRDHDLDAVRSTVHEALKRPHLSENLTLGASPQSLSRP